MNIKVHAFFICFVSLVTASFGQKAEMKSVKTSFKSYQSAILIDKGAEAVRYVDSRTIKYYEGIVDHIRNADSSRIETLPIMDKMVVLSMRHRVSKPELLSLDGKELFIFAIDNGMIGKNGVTNVEIGEVVINSDFAKGQIVANGEKSPIYFHFYKEQSMWKLDLTSLFLATEVVFKAMIEESGQTENEYLFSLLELLTGQVPGPEIWQPLVD